MTVCRGAWPGGTGRTLGARSVCRGGAHSFGPLARLARLVRDVRIGLPLLGVVFGRRGPEITLVARRTLSVGLGVALGLGPFARLTCLVSNADDGFLLAFIIAGGFVGAKPPFAAWCTHRVRVVIAGSLRPFAGVANFVAYIIAVWLQLCLTKVVPCMHA